MAKYLSPGETFPLNVPQMVAFPFGTSRDNEPTEGRYGPFYFVTVEVGGEKLGWSMDAPLYETILSLGLERNSAYAICREKTGKDAQRWKVQTPQGDWIYAENHPVQQQPPRTSLPPHAEVPPPHEEPPPPEMNMEPPPPEPPPPHAEAPPPAQEPQAPPLPQVYESGEIASQCLICARTALSLTMQDMGFSSEDVRALAISMMIDLRQSGYHPAPAKVAKFKGNVVTVAKVIANE